MMDLKSITTTMDLLYHKYLIPMMLLNEQGELLHPHNTLDTKTLVKRYLNQTANETVYMYHMGNYLLGCLQFQTDDAFYYLFVGPCGVIGTPETSCYFLGHEYHYNIHYSKEDKRSFEEYLQLLHTIFVQKVVEKEHIRWFYHSEKESHALRTDLRLETNLYNRRVHEATFDSYHFELRYLDYIRRNEPEKGAWVFNKMKETYDVSLSPFELEGLKLKFSAFVAVVTRMSIDEGVPVNQAFALSDSLIQGLIHIHSAEECLRYIKEATYRFMELLHSYPLAQKSLLVKTIVNYIDSHLYEKITLEELAEVTQKHKTHISGQFKKEMSKTIHTYIQEKKIIEAKHLLLFTDYSCEKISNLLAFSSQSHFIQVFKKITQTTPKQFKDVHYAHYLG
jgi:AraC-like DNA-binding protein